MKKIYEISLLMAALILASSCSSDEGGLNPPEPQVVTLTADAGPTKSLLDAGAVKWENGDEVDLVFTHASKSPAIYTFATEVATPASSADFTGTLPLSVLGGDGGYQETVHAVYPNGSLTAAGKVDFTLPSEQKVRADGTFARGLNLASASVSLSEMKTEAKASATFLNALSIIRFSLTEDITSVTLTGTSPLAGKAPLAFDSDGRLVIDGSWTGSDSVTLKPADGSSNFSDGEVNLLVWPGSHTGMSLSVTSKESGTVEKTSTAALTLLPSKYYTISMDLNSGALLTELDGRVGSIEDALGILSDKIDDAENDAASLDVLLSRIQSVTLLTEYLDNAVYAPYATITGSKEKKDIELQYIIRPASVASELVKKYSEVFTAQIYYDDKTDIASLPVSSVSIDGDILTVNVNASGVSDAFYDGDSEARLALQISDGNTEVLSDFAKLTPVAQAAIKVNYTDDIPVVSGASVTIPFSYALADGDTYSFSCSSNASVRDNKGTGYLVVNISDSTPVEQQTAQLTLTVNGKASVQNFTFVEGGKLVISTDGPVDYIGGEVVVTVDRNDFPSGPLTITSGGGWCTQNNMVFDCQPNTSSGSRTATADYKITYRGLTYTKTVEIVQNGTSAGLTRSYYTNGQYVKLNNADIRYNPLNIVILGDGFQKKDLSKGGKFERIATSACQTFFSIEPYASYKERFNVYMVTYESADEGIDINSSGVSKNTYFDAWCTGGGNTAANCDNNKVINVVKNVLGLSSDASYYRTIAIVLANTSENVGSCAYPAKTTISTSTVGDGYASFAIATLAAYSTGTNGLIKHEAGGHAFGRLGDEYNTGSASRSNTDLDNNHALGFYLNLTYTTGSSCPWYSLVGYDGTGFYEGAWGCSTGYYRPSQSSIMLNNQGEFNAPSRRAIHRRIILQSQGGSYNDSTFKTYDQKNL